MASRVSLLDYQRELSERIRSAGAGRIVSKLGLQVAGESWLVDLADAAEVIPVPPVTPVALMQPWLKGLANVRGTLHTVIDVAVFVGRQPAVAGERTRLLIVAERFGLAAGLLVDASLGLRHPGQLERCDEAPAPWMRAVFADRDGRRWSELDLAGLVQHPGFLAAGV